MAQITSPLQILYSTALAENLYDASVWYKSIGEDWSAYKKGNQIVINKDGSAIAPVAKGSVAAARGTSTQITHTSHSFDMVEVYKLAEDFDVTEENTSNILLAQKALNGFTNSMLQACSQEVRYAWSPTAANTGCFVPTTGTATRLNVYGETVKRMTYDDILEAITTLAKNTPNVNFDNLYLIVDHSLYSDILKMGSEFQGVSSLTEGSTVKGFVGTVAGVKVIRLGLGNPYTALGAKAAVDYDLSSVPYDNTHRSAALLVESTKVGWAMGSAQDGDIVIQVSGPALNHFTDQIQGYTRIGADTLYDKNGAVAVVPGVVAILEAV